MNTFGVKALAFTLLMLVAATVSHAREFSLEDNEEDAVTMVENLASGLGYSQLRYMYDRKDFSPSQDDRYGLLGTGFASLVIPGLGQMICGEFWRGLAWFGGAAACVGVSFLGFAYSYIWSKGWVPAAVLSGCISYLAVDICSVVDAVRVAKVKNMYERDLRSGYSMGMNLYPSVNVMPTSSGIRPVPGLTLAFRF